MSIQLQSSVLLVSLIKSEHPEEVLETEISPDLKDIDIVYHSLSEDLIKSETVPENILETKYSESGETLEVLVKTEGTSDENVTRGTEQEVIEVQASNEHSNTLCKLVTDEQSILNFSKNLNGISVRSRKSKSPKKTDFAEFYKTDDTTLWEKEREKIKVIKTPVIPVEAHEYTFLANDRHVCNHCQQTYKKLTYLKDHIKRMHREVTTMYQCPYCPHKSKWKHHIIKQHIIQKHKDTKDIEWFQCNLCEMKCKLKKYLTPHIKVHLKHKQMQDGLELKRYRCKKCNYKTYRRQNLTKHKITHPKPYFHCYHCSNKYIRKENLKIHIFKHHRNKDVPFHCYICDFVTPKKDLIIEHIRKHIKNHNKYDETISKYQLESRINNLEKRFPNNLEDYCSTIHFDDHVNHIKKQKSEQPESTKSFVSGIESVPENSSKSWLFQCTYCPTRFPKEHLLKGHLQLHSSTKGIECPICTYRHNKTEILKHLSWHGANGEDPFICPICSLKKRTKENMDDHLKVFHSKAIYEKHDFVCKNKTCNGFCQITIGGNVGAE